MTRFKRNVYTFRRGSCIKVFYHPEKGSALSTIGLFSEGATAARCAGKHTRITVNVLKFGTLYAMLFFLPNFLCIYSMGYLVEMQPFWSSPVWVCTIGICYFIRQADVQNFWTSTIKEFVCFVKIGGKSTKCM